MKKMIKKFWGVGLIVVLLSSLFVAAAPVSAADPLTWNMKIDGPGAAMWGLAPQSDITDFDINGSVMYAAVKNNAAATFLVQSATGGSMWTDVTARLPGQASGPVTVELYDIDTVDMVAIAPDDPNVVVVADASSDGGANQVGMAITANGGATWSSMGSFGTVNTMLSGITVSPIVSGGFRYIAAFGTNGANTPVIYYYNYGGGVGAWNNAFVNFTGTMPNATDNVDFVPDFAFSPNFTSDFMGVALNADGGDSQGPGFIKLNMLSFNQFKWNTESGYPVSIYTGGSENNTTVTTASLALSPDFDGGDESLRNTFIGATISEGAAATQLGGIWRTLDSFAARIYGSSTAGVAINSVAFDGTNLAAGSYITNNVFRSADPMAATPTILGARNMKKIGIDDVSGVPDTNYDKVLVKFGGETLYGSKQLDGSALSKSTDYGNVWNDYTLIDGGSDASNWLGNPATQAFLGPGTVTDIYMTGTGDPWFLVANDATKTSVYRISMFAFQRVLCISKPTPAAFLLRGRPADAGVIYAANRGGTDIYQSNDGGLTKWNKRAAPQAIQDLAVETKEVIYVGQNGSVSVFKSINSGFTWNTGVSCKMTTSTINTLLSLGEGKLLVGGSAGGVAYSSDGAVTFTNTLGTFRNLPVQVAATGLSAGDFIFAGDSSTTAAGAADSSAIMRCVIGPSNPAGEFKSMGMTGKGTAAVPVNRFNVTGMAYTNGILYVVTSNGTASYLNRTLMPAVPGTHVGPMWSTEFGPTASAFNLAPSALKTSSGAPGSIMLYANTGALTFYFDDAVALSGPTLSTPPDKDKIEIISPLTGNVQSVNFMWSRNSLSTNYQLQMALDSGFTSLVNIDAAGTGAIAGPEAEIFSGAPTVSQIIPGSAGNNNFLLPGNTYYWRIRSYAPMSSPWSEVRSFMVQPTAATVPTIGGPVSGSTLTTLKPAFSWSPVSGTTSYKFQLSEGTAFAAPIYDGEVAVAGAQLPLTVTLEDGKTYFWRVKALAPVEGDWSSIANFTVAIPVSTTAAPPVVITSQPAPTFTITQPAPTSIVIPAPPPENVINPAYIWVIIIIGAVLVIAVIVLIVRTRRSV